MTRKCFGKAKETPTQNVEKLSTWSADEGNSMIMANLNGVFSCSAKGLIILAVIVALLLVVGFMFGKNECKSKLDEQSKTLKDEQTRLCESKLDELEEEQSRACKRKLDEQGEEQSRICKRKLDEQGEEQSRICKRKLDEQGEERSRICKRKLDEQGEEQSRICKRKLDEQGEERSRICKRKLDEQGEEQSRICKRKLDEQGEEQNRTCKRKLDEQGEEQSRICKRKLDEQGDEQSRICESKLDKKSKIIIDEQNRICKREQDEQSKNLENDHNKKFNSQLNEQTRIISELEAVRRDQDVITAQVQLIMNWKKVTKEFIEAINDQIEGVVRYCELKEKGGYFDSLSDIELYTMNRLRDKLGDVTIPAKEVRAILVDITGRLKQSLTKTLSELEDALHDLPWKINRMKQQQKQLSDEEILKILENLENDWKEEFGKAQKGVSRSPWKQILRHVSEFLHNTLLNTFGTVWSFMKT